MKHYTTTAVILLTAALTVSCNSSKKLQNPNNPSTDNTVVVTPSNSTDMDEAYLTPPINKLEYLQMFHSLLVEAHITKKHAKHVFTQKKN